MGAGTAGNTAVWIGLNYYGRKAKMLFEEWRTILKTKRADKKNAQTTQLPFSFP